MRIVAMPARTRAAMPGARHGDQGRPDVAHRPGRILSDLRCIHLARTMLTELHAGDVALQGRHRAAVSRLRQLRLEQPDRRRRGE